LFTISNDPLIIVRCQFLIFCKLERTKVFLCEW